MITKENWLELIKNWNKKEFPVILEREINISTDLEINRVFSLIGPRRAGKTFELLFIARKIAEKIIGEEKEIHWVLSEAELHDSRYCEKIHIKNVDADVNKAIENDPSRTKYYRDWMRKPENIGRR